MTKRHNHYEAAFEEYLRQRGTPYVAVDEARRALIGGDTLKSLDFIVTSPGGGQWLVDVKGRQFPSGTRRKMYWKNWSTQDEVESLGRWETSFGGRFAGLFVFAYAVTGDVAPLPAEQLFAFRERLYGFVAVRLGEYAQFARRISAKWDTVAVPATTFRRLAEPVSALF